MLISILSMLSVHSYAECEWLDSFIEGYRDTFNNKNEGFSEVFLIKGIASDVYEYGRTIKVIEDLKGNFVGDSSIFVWGDYISGFDFGSFHCMSVERMDDITKYQENDTLIMLVFSVGYEQEQCLETFGDYVTVTCAHSVLKFSNGFVTGHITPFDVNYGLGITWEEWYNMTDDERYAFMYSLSDEEWAMFLLETTMPWEELQELLFSLTAIRDVKINNTIYQSNGTVFFENPENKAVKLSFYDLSGRLVHETATTSNTYRPVLKKNIYVCRININGEQQTIKYIAQ